MCQTTAHTSAVFRPATGPAPVLFGAGYVNIAEWWKLGAIVSTVNILIWLGLGGIWWKIIRLW